ncbi:FMN-binding protein [Candidatus Saccharibacteria bacterium]|nr:FMN-binding protein [Candidatus Saccharibacteria bacterium]
MKRFLLSGFMVLAFIVYSFQQRREGSQTTVAVPLTPSQSPVNQNTSTTPPSTDNTATQTSYRDGQYTGNKADAYYGYIQVRAIVSGGKLTDVQFLQYPNDRQNSIRINQQAMPYLKQEAITAQSAKVDIISGASDTSTAFIESLTMALNQAKL